MTKGRVPQWLARLGSISSLLAVTVCRCPQITSGYKNIKENVKSKTKGLRFASINVRTLQEDIKLATIIKVTESLIVDVLALQEVRRTEIDCLEFNDKSLWQFAWSGYNVKNAKV